MNRARTEARAEARAEARSEARAEAEAAAEQRLAAALALERAEIVKQARSLLCARGGWLQRPSLVLQRLVCD